MTEDAPHIPPVDTGSYPLRHGNRVRPLVDGEPAFLAIGDAVEAAKHAVWVTIAFHQDDFEMPGGRGSLFDVLDAATARGLDVRVLFWRSPEQEEEMAGVHFPGTDAQRTMLAQRGSRFRARWDRLPKGLCHHQKSWLIDVGQADEIAFVGGINLNAASVATPRHERRDHGSTHDVYVEVLGPAATDVHHNFVQRWNEASERTRKDGIWPPSDNGSDLAFPTILSPEAGNVPVQISRTVRRECYRVGHPPPGGSAFEIERGEFSVLDQYIAAIDAAREAIYIEDQAIASPAVIERLDAALLRGVEVVFLVPGNAHSAFVAARRNPALSTLFDPLHALGRFEHFCLVGIASHAGPGTYQDVYVHAKIALVDDAWATIGSTNVADRSFRGDTELNASFWHGETVSALRVDLLREHLGHDTAHLDMASALRDYRDVARKNRALRTKGERMQGMAFEIDITHYGIPATPAPG